MRWLWYCDVCVRAALWWLYVWGVCVWGGRGPFANRGTAQRHACNSQRAGTWWEVLHGFSGFLTLIWAAWLHFLERRSLCKTLIHHSSHLPSEGGILALKFRAGELRGDRTASCYSACVQRRHRTCVSEGSRERLMGLGWRSRESQTKYSPCCPKGQVLIQERQTPSGEGLRWVCLFT